MTDLILWPHRETNDTNRTPRAYRHCSCHSCENSRPDRSVGYLSASNEHGEGFTLYIQDEDTFELMASIFGEVV